LFNANIAGARPTCPTSGNADFEMGQAKKSFLINAVPHLPHLPHLFFSRARVTARVHITSKTGAHFSRV
jgi:hypothetical protein